MSAPTSGTEEQHDPTIGLKDVESTIAQACAAAGRDRGSVTLVAASKTVSAQTLTSVIDAGLLVYGENRVQEGVGKWPGLRERYPALELHLLGPLQTNKVREAVALFDVIHSVDRVKLCDALARQCAAQDRRPRIFIQVNTAAEPQKGGVLPAGADALIAAARDDFGLDVVGLMCIPPYDQPSEPDFDLLAGIAERNGLGGLSMGMSHDYPSAIVHGATHVRVGTAIFGARVYPPGKGPAARIG